MAKTVEGAVAETPATETVSEQVNAEGAGKKKSTAKSKEALGVPDDHKITWVPFAMSPEDNELINRVAAARQAALPEGGKYHVHQVLAGIIADGITPEVKAGWADEAKNAPERATRSKAVVIPDDPAEAEKVLIGLKEKAERALAKQNAALEKAQAALAAARAKMASGGSAESTSTANDESDGAAV